MSEGKSVLVTGGSRGIGAAISLLAGRRGYRVAVNYHANRGAAEDVVRQIEAAGGEAFAIQGDASSETDIVFMFAEIDRRFGRLDALVNNAGIVAEKARLDQMDAGRIERMLRINLLGPLLVSREAVKRMSPLHGGKGGSIVNISSVAAMLGINPLPEATEAARPTRMDLPPSDKLSIVKNGPQRFAGRKVGILAGNGACGATFAGLESAIQTEGAMYEIIAPHMGE